MRIRISYIILFSCLTLFCTDHEDIFKRPYPSIETKTVTDIKSTGAKFNGAVLEANGNEILDHGFVWGTDYTLNLDGDNRKSLGEFNGSGAYSAEISTTLQEGKTYYVKTYVKTEKLTIYGEIVSFVSLGSKAPVITDFFPKSGSTFDTVSIRGTGFSFLKKDNAVKFSDKTAEIITSTDSLLRVLVPGTLNTVKSTISVSVVGNIAQASDEFQLLTAEIFSIAKSTVKSCDTLAIEGKNFPLSVAGVKVYLNTTACEVLTTKSNRLHVRIPAFLPASETVSLKVVSSNIETTFSSTLTYKKPVVVDIVSRPNTTFNDTLKIVGKNLPRCIAMELKIGTVTPTLVMQNDSVVSFIIPESLTQTTNTAIVTYTNTSVSFSNLFSLSPPIVSSASPSAGTFGDLVTIHGKNFHPVKERNHITLAGADAEILTAEPKKLVIKVSNSSRGDCCENIIANVDARYGTDQTVFTLNPPIITSVSQSTFTEPGIVTITGENFNTQQELNSVVLNGFKFLDILSATSQEIVANISADVVSNGDVLKSFFSIASLRVKTGQQYSNQEQIIIDYKGPWKQLPDFPTAARGQNISFTLNDKFYVGLGLVGNTFVKDIWEFDPALNTWTQKSDFPGAGRLNAVSFACDGKAYVALGSNSSGQLITEIWQYNPVPDTWTQLNNFPGQPRPSAGAFAIDNFGYLIGGDNSLYSKEVWKYNPANDSWQQLSNLPVSVTYPNNFILNGKAYILTHGYEPDGRLYSYIHEYTAETDTWVYKLRISPSQYAPYAQYNKAIAGGYLMYYSGFYKYNPVSNTVESIISKMSNRWGSMSAEINGKTYIFGGFISSLHPNWQISDYKDFWEFDYTHYPQ